eukprot:420984-Alexandrium_andersonii.AAC.1
MPTWQRGVPWTRPPGQWHGCRRAPGRGHQRPPRGHHLPQEPDPAKSRSPCNRPRRREVRAA